MINTCSCNQTHKACLSTKMTHLMQILRFINSKLIIQKHIYATKVGQLTYMCNMYQEQQISRVVCELKLVSNQVTKICEVVQAIQESSGATSININNVTHQPLQELLRADFPSFFFFFSFFFFLCVHLSSGGILDLSRFLAQNRFPAFLMQCLTLS